MSVKGGWKWENRNYASLINFAFIVGRTYVYISVTLKYQLQTISLEQTQAFMWAVCSVIEGTGNKVLAAADALWSCALLSQVLR